MVNRITLPVCTALARVMHPGSVKYSYGFEDNSFGVDGWSGFLGPGSTSPHHGNYTGVLQTINGTKTLTRSLTGLTIGRRYLLTAWAGHPSTVASGAILFSVGVSGIGSSTPAGGTVNSYDSYRYRQHSYTFTPTATSHTLQLIVTASTASLTPAWDDIRVAELEYQVGSDIALGLKSGKITLDERQSPYAEASLQIALPSQADLTLLDTRGTNTVRIHVTTSQTFVTPVASPQSRTFNLLLHERRADHRLADLGVTLIARSDEALLIDAGNETATIDSTFVADQKSLRSIVATMLEAYFATLEPGTADADYTITTAATNMFINPSGETTATDWAAGSGATAIARVTVAPTGGFLFGAACIRGTAGAGSANFTVGGGTSVTEGNTYVFSMHVNSQVSRAGSLNLQWQTSGGSVISTSTATISGGTVAGSWARYSLTAVAPATATKVVPFLQTTGNAAGNLHYMDGAMFTVGATLLDYFDGTFPVDAYYSYAWTGTAHASTSQRIRLDARDPQLLYQEPGVKDWDLIAPLVQQAGLRLFCDEQRRWYLVDPVTYTPGGSVALPTSHEATDVISRENGDWCDAVVVSYRWIGTDGLGKQAWDAATAGGTCLLAVDIARPYPGPGAATAILARYQGRGRVQELTAPPDLTTAPGMALTTTLPNTPNQGGAVSKVEFVFSEDTIDMNIRARDLVNV